MPTQKYSSAKTDIKQVPAIWKILNDKMDPRWWGATNDLLDYGGGASDKLSDKFAERHVRSLVLDPFNRSDDHNALVRRIFEIRPADAAVCSNVLNVIREPAVRLKVIQDIADLTNPDGYAFFTVYEGNRTSRGRRTGPDTWQNNRPLKSYVRELRKVFGEGVFVGKAIACTGRR